jgi:maltose alpha-D-glucosyltransferase/alpha-amylase
LAQELAVADVSFHGGAGLLTDAFSLPVFARNLLEGLSSSARIAASDGEILFEDCEQVGVTLPRADDDSVTWLPGEQSNSSLISRTLGDAEDFSPGRRRTARRGGDEPLPDPRRLRQFAMLGEVTRVDGAGQRHSLAVAQAFVPNHGDAWSWMQRRLAERLDAGARGQADDRAGEDCEGMAVAVGRRLGEMHVVLARPTDNPAFSPRQALLEDVAAWVGGAEQELARAFTALGDDADTQADRRELVQHRAALLRALPRLAAAGSGRQPDSRRFPSWPGAGGRARRPHHRLRG